jgi:hypothetical protein
MYKKYIFIILIERILEFSLFGPVFGINIPDPKTGTKERGEIFFFVKPFYVATNSTKIIIILFLKC